MPEMLNFVTVALSVFITLTYAAPLQPFGTAVGDRLLDKANHISVEVAISHSFVFLEHSYRQLYLGANGYISFNQPFTTYTATRFPVNGISLLSAFWSDNGPSANCSTFPGGNSNNNIFYREITDQNSPVLREVSNQIRAYDGSLRSFHAQWVFVFTFSRVIECGTSCSPQTPANTFQIILATDGRYSFSIFNYDKIEFINDGGSIYAYAIAGFNRFDGQYYKMIDGSGTANVRNIVTTSNTGVPGRWIFRVDGDTVTGVDCGTLSNSRAISVSPKYGSVLGGNEIIVSGVCFGASTPTNQIICKLGSESLPGQQHGPTSVRCVAPTPGEIGVATLSISVDNGATFPYTSTYTFDSTTYPARLINQHLWESQRDTKLQVQWNPYDIDADLDILQNNSKVAVDLVGWYISGSDITRHVRTIVVPFVPSAINTGRMDITLKSAINLHQPSFPNEKYTFLRGSLRLMKDNVRNAAINGNGILHGSQSLPVSLWTPLFDIDFLQRLIPRSSQNNHLPDASDLAGGIVTYTVRRPLQPLFGRRAVQALAFYKGSETLLSQAQWNKYLAGFPERHQMMNTILECTADTDFCGCWANAERRTLRYDSSDCADFPGCPANANQARLDRARFSVENPLTSSSACNRIYTAVTSLWPISPCAENRASILCVVAPTASRKYQQQCCYSDNDHLILANMHPGGGRVKLVVQDRKVAGVSSGSVWLAQKLEEAVTDRLPMKKCCGSNWNTNSCQLFRDVRKGGSSRCYQPPRPAVGFGDPHIQTYDGFRYTFNGLGEYILLEIPSVITVQGRTARAKSEQGVLLLATVWSALAFRVGNTTMQVGNSTRGDGLDLYLNRAKTDLETIPGTIILNDSIIHLDRQNGSVLSKVSAQLALGILVEIEKVDLVIQFQVSLPITYKNSQSVGLLGRWNDNATDDLLPRGHTVPLHPNSSTQEIFAFGETWRIRKNESLFQYQVPETYESVNDLSFRPLFAAPVIANAALKEEAEKLCGENAECMFDVASTGLLRMGRATKNFMVTAEEEFNTSRIIVTSCGYPVLHESVVIASNSSFTSGESVQLTCRNNSISRISGSTALLCSAEGKWTGEALKCDGNRVYRFTVFFMLAFLGACFQ